MSREKYLAFDGTNLNECCQPKYMRCFFCMHNFTIHNEIQHIEVAWVYFLVPLHFHEKPIEKRSYKKHIEISGVQMSAKVYIKNLRP